MRNASFSVVILGAGPVGSVLALLLARHAPDPARIALVQNHPRSVPTAITASSPPSSPDPHLDARVLALNHGSLVLLESLGVHCAPSAPIHHIHVSQRGKLGRTVIQSTDFEVPQLGRVTGYSALQRALATRLAACGVTHIHGDDAHVTYQDHQQVWIRHTSPQTPHNAHHTGHKTPHDAYHTNHQTPHSTHHANHQTPHSTHHTNHQTLHSTHHASLHSAVTVVASGSALSSTQRDYAQHAVLTTVRASQPKPGWAFERFTQDGPLALLPHPYANDCYAVVWCCTPEAVNQLALAEDAMFSQAITHAFGARLGTLSCVAPRHVSPLFMRYHRHPVKGRVVTMGNAAQTLHPVAGQGLNLGLRDAARLAQALTPWLASPQHDPRSTLQDYDRARWGDRWLTRTITDLLPRISTSRLAPVAPIFGGMLLGLDLLPFLRAPLARHLLQGWRL